jgi:hypothetical protein
VGTIISASRRTDIPAFYSDWFINRIREGYALVQNPFNGSMFSRVDLTCADVDVIVFWTRDARPMLKHLDELDRRGYRYYFHYTLNALPRLLEPRVPTAAEAVATFRDLSRAIGSERIIWRFDPVVVSDVTPEEWIYRNFEGLASQLRGLTSRVVISFADYYAKVARSLGRVTGSTGVRFYDVHCDPARLLRIASRLSEIAHCHSISPVSCAEKADLAEVGIDRGKCISDELISTIFGIHVDSRKDRYQRKACGCVSSRDIGHYDTCVHGCIYCYATFNGGLSSRNRASHDPSGPAMVESGPRAP